MRESFSIFLYISLHRDSAFFHPFNNFFCHNLFMEYSRDEKVKKSLRVSFFEGAFASGMVGFTQDYFTPFLLLLGGTARHVGALSAFPNLFASLIQIKVADLADRFKSRKKIVNIFVLLQGLALLPLIVISLFQYTNPIFFIITVVFFTSFGAIATPAWGSMMSDLVSEDKRGEYFGWRNRFLGFIAVGSAFIAGIILHRAKAVNLFSGFAVIFSIAFIFRVISLIFLNKMHEPPLEYHKVHYFTFIDFISRIKESNFAKFVIFVSMMSFSVNLASPFFSVLMLRDLHFSYMLYAAITVTATLTIYIMINRWGRLADKIGNIRIIRFTAPLIALIPLLWIINRSPLFLIFAQFISGFAWAGFNLSASNFIYDAVTPPKRTRCICYFNFFNGLALCGGALLGGLLLRNLPPFLGYRILTLFLLSSALRLIVSFFGPMKIKEVRQVQEMNSNQLFFGIVGIKPLLGIERKTIRY